MLFVSKDTMVVVPSVNALFKDLVARINSIWDEKYSRRKS